MFACTPTTFKLISAADKLFQNVENCFGSELGPINLEVYPLIVEGGIDAK